MDDLHKKSHPSCYILIRWESADAISCPNLTFIGENTLTRHKTKYNGNSREHSSNINMEICCIRSQELAEHSQCHIPYHMEHDVNQAEARLQSTLRIAEDGIDTQ